MPYHTSGNREKQKAIDALMLRRRAITGRGATHPEPVPDIPDKDEPIRMMRKKKKRKWYHLLPGGNDE